MKLKEMCYPYLEDFKVKGRLYITFNNKQFSRFDIIHTNNELIFKVRDGHRWQCTTVYRYLKKLPQNLEIVVSIGQNVFNLKTCYLILIYLILW